MITLIKNSMEEKFLLKLLTFKEKVKTKAENSIVSCDAVFLVLMAVLLTLAFSILAGMAIWCVVYKEKHFTGKWSWGEWFIDVNVECV